MRPPTAGRTASGECTRHAIERLWERYRIELDEALQETIHRRIQSGRATPIKEQRDDAGTFLLDIAGQRVGVLYSVKYLRIITILPPTDLRVQRA
jgi:hypothetical protein